MLQHLNSDTLIFLLSNTEKMKKNDNNKKRQRGKKEEINLKVDRMISMESFLLVKFISRCFVWAAEYSSITCL